MRLQEGCALLADAYISYCELSVLPVTVSTSRVQLLIHRPNRLKQAY